MISCLLLSFSDSSIYWIASSFMRAASRSSLSLFLFASSYTALNSLSAALWLISSRFLSLFNINFYLSASLSASISLAHYLLSISYSLSLFSFSISVTVFLYSFYQVKILRVSFTFFFFSSISYFSLAFFFSRSSIQSLAYTYSSIIYYSSFDLLSINCFSLSN